MLRRYQHLIWDWNGTLLDDLQLCIEVTNSLLRQRRLPPLDLTRYHAVFGFPVRAYYAEIGLATTEETFKALSVDFISAYEARRLETRLHPGAEELLAAIPARGLTQSILSAYRHDTLCEIVAHFGLTSRFVALSGLDNIYAHSKAALGRAALARLGVPAAKVLMIGDTLHDLEVAREMGVDCVLVSHGHHPAERLRQGGVPVFPNLHALGAAFGLPAFQSSGSGGGGNGNLVSR
ncbi:HAD family hydrolase [Opitutus sp. ER46]|nr:HAD family hydrolase [Opitutus sp. ER46]